MATDWVHQDHVCLLIKETDLIVSLHNFPLDFYQRHRDSRSCTCYKVCGVEKLTDNWNLYKKESTCPKLDLYLRNVDNMVAYILWWLLMSIVFFKWESSDIQVS